MNLILQILCILLQLYIVVLIARIILSWVPNLPEPIRPVARAVGSVTDPVLRPIRGLIPPVRLGGAALDLSPILLFLAIGIVSNLLCQAAG